MPEITIRRHPTLDACLATHLPPEVMESPGDWEMGAIVAHGEEYEAGSSRASEFVALIRENCRCWGH